MEEYIVSAAYDGKPRKMFSNNCAVCGDTFYAPKHAARKYCGDRCFRISLRTGVKRKCDNCGSEFVRKPSSLLKSKSGLLFCTRRCKDEAQRMGKHNAILRPRSHKDGSRAYRAIAFRNHPLRCNRCGYETHIGVLRVHHRDRNRRNNFPENLEILCPTCHEVDHFLHKDGAYGGGRKKRGRSDQL